MEFNFFTYFHYLGYFFTNNLLYFGHNKCTNFIYNIYLQVLCSGFDHIIHREPSCASQTMPMQPSHYPHIILI